jgi:hypothetical protein
MCIIIASWWLSNVLLSCCRANDGSFVCGPKCCLATADVFATCAYREPGFMRLCPAASRWASGPSLMKRCVIRPLTMRARILQRWFMPAQWSGVLIHTLSDVVGFVSGGHAPLHRNRSSDSGSLGFWFAICLNEPARPSLPSGRGVLSSSRWLLVFVSRQTLISELGLSQTKSIEDFWWAQTGFKLPGLAVF